jgi:hypothetical protein
LFEAIQFKLNHDKQLSYAIRKKTRSNCALHTYIRYNYLTTNKPERRLTELRSCNRFQTSRKLPSEVASAKRNKIDKLITALKSQTKQKDNRYNSEAPNANNAHHNRFQNFTAIALRSCIP